MTINTTRLELMLAERGMTRTALAASCGISRQNISTVIRRGTCEPKTAPWRRSSRRDRAMYFAIMLAGAWQVTRWIMFLVERIEEGG